VADNGQLNVRAIADPFTKATKSGNPMVIEGRNLLALGSVGIALEAFRKAQREQPDNIEAIAGIAECYERMGRYDVARSKYEEALAIAPNNPVLLNTFAASLERQGLRAQAQELRAEANEAEAASVAALTASAAQASAVLSPPPPPKLAKAIPSARQPASAAASPPIARVAQVAPSMSQLATATPPPVVARVAQAAPPIPAKPAAPPVVVAVKQATPAAPKPIAQALSKAEPVSVTTWTFEPSPVSMSSASPTARAHALSADSVTIKVARDQEPTAVAKPVATSAEPLRVAQAPQPSITARVRALLEATRAEPRLERLSPGEVALVTRGGPIWRPQVVAQSRQSVTVRFVPLQQAPGVANIRVLNAARREGIAARTRQVLLDRGWRKIQIGDAPGVRESSLVLYPANRRALGRSLAAQFGFRSAVSNEAKELVVLIGRDAAVGSSGRSKA